MAWCSANVRFDPKRTYWTSVQLEIASLYWKNCLAKITRANLSGSVARRQGGAYDTSGHCEGSWCFERSRYCHRLHSVCHEIHGTERQKRVSQRLRAMPRTPTGGHASSEAQLGACPNSRMLSFPDNVVSPEEEATMAATHKGECFCGAVHVEVLGEPVAMGYCHCQSCRSWSAAPVTAFTLGKPDAVRLTAAAEHVATFQKTKFK